MRCTGSRTSLSGYDLEVSRFHRQVWLKCSLVGDASSKSGRRAKYVFIESELTGLDVSPRSFLGQCGECT
jgi:hypothetical protein